MKKYELYVRTVCGETTHFLCYPAQSEIDFLRLEDITQYDKLTGYTTRIRGDKITKIIWKEIAE